MPYKKVTENHRYGKYLNESQKKSTFTRTVPINYKSFKKKTSTESNCKTLIARGIFKIENTGTIKKRIIPRNQDS